MKFNEQDFLIIKQDTKKLLVKATSVAKDGTGHALTTTIEPEGHEVTEENILAVLGPKLPSGSAFGVKLEAYIRTTPTDMGDVDWYVKPEKEARKAMHDAINKVYGNLVKINAHGFLPCKIEVRAPKGKYAGMYYYNTAKGDRLVIHPKGDAWKTDLEYVVAHEAGHGVWYRMLSEKVQASWVRLYHKCVTVTDVTDKQLAKVLSYFEPDEANDGYVSAVRGQLDEDLVPIYDEVIAYMCATQSLDLEALDLMSRAGHDLKAMFPSVAALTDVEPLITEYGARNYKEYWAEAFAFYLVGLKLPKSVQPLMERTIQYLKTR